MVFCVWLLFLNVFARYSHTGPHSIPHSLLFTAASVVRYMNRPHDVSPPISWWTAGLFPFFSSYEQCWYEYCSTSFCVDIRLESSWDTHLGTKVVGETVTACLTIWGTARLFSEVPHHFTLRPRCAGVQFSMPLPTLVLPTSCDLKKSPGNNLSVHRGRFK